MRSKGASRAARVTVECKVANYRDITLARHGLLGRDQIRRMTIQGNVDLRPGMLLVLPQSVVKQMGLPLGDTVTVRYANGRRARRREAEDVYIELLGRSDTFKAVVEPNRRTARIGTIVLQALDLLVDPKRQRLIPRDPSGPIYEIE